MHYRTSVAQAEKLFHFILCPGAVFNVSNLQAGNTFIM